MDLLFILLHSLMGVELVELINSAGVKIVVASSHFIPSKTGWFALVADSISRLVLSYNAL